MANMSVNNELCMTFDETKKPEAEGFVVTYNAAKDVQTGANSEHLDKRLAATPLRLGLLDPKLSSEERRHFVVLRGNTATVLLGISIGAFTVGVKLSASGAIRSTAIPRAAQTTRCQQPGHANDFMLEFFQAMLSHRSSSNQLGTNWMGAVYRLCSGCG
jgi:hypothetical protein